MTSSELKELVKSHFSLVEKAEVTTEKFGEAKDVNGAFTIKFPGDSIQVGDKVTIVTEEGQEMDAPDGTHEFEDGTKIRTVGSVVEEIYSADGEKELSAVEMAKESTTEEFDARTDAEEEGYLDGIKDEKADEKDAMADVESIVEAIVSQVKEEMASMKSKMSELETKVAELLDAPAAEATILTPNEMTSKAKFSMFNVETAANADRIRATMSALKNKKK